MFYETGDAASGAAFLEGWLPGYPPDAGFFVHNHWHLAVFELQLGRFGRAMSAYRAGVSPDQERAGTILLIGGGGAALLWRALLAGHSVEAPLWTAVRDYFGRMSPRFGGPYRPLWDSFAAVVYAATGDEVGHRALRERLAAADASRYPQAASVVLPLAGALWAFARGDFAGAAAALEALAPAIVRIGGSNEQRDTFDDTVVAALVRAGRHEQAERLLRERLARRESAQDSLWLAEVLAETGRPAEAAPLLERAAEGWATADSDGPERSALRRTARSVPSTTIS